jgi:hypothetical protein
LFPKEWHGSITNLLSCLRDWVNLVDSDKSVDVLYLHFSKVFNKVPKHLLLINLKLYGITGHLYKGISEILANRKFKVGESSSYGFDVLCGVPQGLVLGPQLFL